MDWNEQMLFFVQMQKLLMKIKQIVPQTDVLAHHKLDDLKGKLFDILAKMAEDDYEPSKIQPSIDNLWNEIENLMIELKDDSVRVENHLNSINFAYRYWLWLHEEPLPYGYSDKHVELLQSDSNPSGRHRYNGRPSQIVWETIPVKQNDGLTYYVAIADINEVDAVSSVPSFKNDITITKVSEKILETTRSNMKEWQRPLDPKRILKIAEFLDQCGNGIANAPMLFMPNSDFVEFERNSSNEIYRVKIDFQFLKECQERGSPFMTDHRGLIDLRPLEIIDGQHRIRGAMRSQRGHNLKIPIILFPPELEQSGAAKFFAEINTQSVPLNKLHALFMRHRFGLGSTKPSLNYERYDGTRNTETARTNRRAYEAGAFCSSNKSNSEESLFELIKVLDENPEKNCIIEIDMWVKTARPWFSSSGPYGPGKIDEGSENWKIEIRNFFDAFMLVCNETDWWYGSSGDAERKKDERPRWLKSDKLGVNDNGRGNKPYIQFKNTIRALMNQLPLIVNKIRDSGFPPNTEEVIPISKFKEALKVLSNIDWLDSRVKALFVTGGAEYPWQSLSAWFSDTIIYSPNSPYDLQDVMSENIQSVAGKGLLSAIKKADVVLAPGSPAWPTIDNPVKLISNRPINAHTRNVTTLMNSDFESLNEAAKLKGSKHTIRDDKITFNLEYGDWCNSNDKVTVTVIWGNRKQRDVSSTLELTKPT